MIWGPGQIAMMGAGGALALLGAWVFIFLRPDRRADQGPRLAGTRSARKLTEPTRIVIALVCLIAGYHLLVWSQPAWAVGVQFSRRLWYVWLVIGVAAITGSFALDQLERNKGAGGDGPP